MRRALLLSLFDPSTKTFLVPTKAASAAARRRGQGRPKGRRASRAFLEGDEHGRTLADVGILRGPANSRSGVLAAILLAVLLAAAIPSASQAHETRRETASITRIIDEAAARFRVPSAWIYAVISAESGGEPSAVSPKGAMGLMQLMPGTWRDLSAQYGLGPDPFDRRANVLAGTAYLRQLFDRFGREGFLGAYNAGPARYAAAVEGRRKLPGETLIYVAAVERAMASRASSFETSAPADWRSASLFSEGGSRIASLNGGDLFVQASGQESRR